MPCASIPGLLVLTTPRALRRRTRPPDPDFLRGGDAPFEGHDNRGDDGDEIDIGDFEMEDDLESQAPDGYGSFASSGINDALLQTMASFVQETASEFYRSQQSKPFRIARNESGRGVQGFADPIDCIDNYGQRFALCFYLDFFEALYLNEQPGAPTEAQTTPPNNLRVLLMGVAGTGKSYVLKHIESFASIFTGRPDATCAVAPTGAAAVGIGASTADRAFAFSRAQQEPKDLPANALTLLQTKYRHTIGAAADEVSMWGQRMMGHFAFRTGEIFNEGPAQDGTDPITVESSGDVGFGGVKFMMFMGDQKQLAPVLDPSQFSEPSKTPAGKLGYRAYRSLRDVLLLDQPERQDPNSDIYRALNNLRGASVGQWDLDFWQSRSLNLLRATGHTASWAMANPGVLHATCYNKDRDGINQGYIKRARDVCVVKAACAGVHALAEKSPKGGQLLKLPRTGQVYPCPPTFTCLVYIISPCMFYSASILLSWEYGCPLRQPHPRGGPCEQLTRDRRLRALSWRLRPVKEVYAPYCRR